MLGAQGALIGTRFYASAEALGQDRAKQRIVAAHGGETGRTRVFDLIRGYAWPPVYPGRAIRNGFMQRWDGRESDLAQALETERAGYQAAARDGDFDTAVVWAGEAIDLIKSVDSASAIVARISAEAKAQLRAGAKLAR
jgi:nitronate monooxygenase